MTNQNKTVDALIADNILSVQEKIKKLIALDFPNLNALKNYKHLSTMKQKEWLGVLASVLVWTTFYLLLVFVVPSSFIISKVFAVLFATVSAVFVAFPPLFLLVYFVEEKWAYFDRKLFFGFFFKKINGRNTLKMWEREEEDYRKTVGFLEENLNEFSSDNLYFLSTSKTLPLWVNEWAKKHYMPHEKNLEIQQASPFFNKPKSITVFTTKETTENVERVSVCSREIAKI